MIASSGLVVSAVDAQSTDTFLVEQLIVSDSEAPAAPTSSVAIPLSTSQITLNWTAATDNIGVTGYLVFRDAVQIATTSLLSYLDTGLSNNTTYEYALQAFDAAGNISTSSIVFSTTTLAAVVQATTTPSTGSAGGGVARSDPSPSSILSDIVVVTTEDLATISFATSLPSQVEIRWGTTSSYELGYSASSQYQTNHIFAVTSLEPNTGYQAQIVATDSRGNRIQRLVYFTTDAGIDTVAPANVSDFLAVEADGGVRLSWQNPEDEDFDRVRIVRSSLFYPTDDVDGLVIFDGVTSSYLDTTFENKEGIYYYSVFAYDATGNRSSGAVALFQWPGQEGSLQIGTVPDFSVSSGIFPVYIGRVGAEAQYINSTTSKMVQNANFTISVPYDALLPNLKTILVTLTHPDTVTSFSFILRRNEERTAYEAVLRGLTDPGEYQIVVQVIDYSEKTTEIVTGSISVTEDPFAGRVSATPPILWWPPLLLLLPLLVHIFLVRRIFSLPPLIHGHPIRRLFSVLK